MEGSEAKDVHSATQPPRHPLHGVLGRHVPRLLHIQQLKDSITQQHRALLNAAIADKQRRNEETIRQQQLELAARRHRKQLAAHSAQTAATDAATDVQPPAAATAAESAPSHPASTSTSTTAPSPPTKSPFLPLPPLPNPADMAVLTSTSPASYTDAQMLALLPSVLAVHLLHCGFSSYPRSALSVLSEATIDFIRRAGVALRATHDETSKAKRKVQKKKKNGMRNGRAEASSSSWLTPRLLRSLAVSDVRTLQRFHDRTIGRAEERIRQTEERLANLDTQLRSERADTVLRLTSAEGGSNINSSSVQSARWLCEPFSPLRTFVQPPAMPASPPPLEEEKVDEQPTQPATNAAGSSGNGSGPMAVDAASSAAPAAVTAQSNESGVVSASDPSISETTMGDVQARDIAPNTASSEEQGAALLPPLESVDGLHASQPTQLMVD